jgi:hypothetical protein
MKKLVLILIICSLLFLVIGCTQVPTEEDIYACNLDDDCVLVSMGCCTCSSGGSNTAINKSYLDYWNDSVLGDCGDTMCLTVMSGDPSCLGAVEALCSANKCVVQPDPSFN